MEALLQQECLNESQLTTYRSQLDVVERQLKVGVSESDAADLEQLRDNLTQLISLTEDALLDIKKQRLLLSLQAVGGEPHSGEQPSREGERAEAERRDQESRDSEDESDNLQGIKCQAPMKESWRSINYHNAVILCREEKSGPGKEEKDEEGVKVQVLFTHPTYNAMKPCAFFLDGKCRFESSVCKFSHGHLVPFSELLPYQEPDYNLACIGGKCLSKHTDGLWYPAIISSFDEEFTVHFPSLNVTVQTPLENVFPLEDSESSSGSCASSESGEDGEGVEEQVEWVPSGAQRALGEWEKHTTGIGSRLLAKMGYVVGKGLGKSGEGRVEPVEIKIYPVGKSLDVCAEMREKGKLRRAPGEGGQGKRRRRRKKKLTAAAASIEEAEKVDIFDFLNAKLRRSDPTKESSRPTTKGGNLNVQLFQVQEDIKSVSKRRQSLMAQLARHKGRDKTMEAHVSEKLLTVDREIERLQTEEKRIEKSLAMKSERKKLRIF